MRVFLLLIISLLIACTNTTEQSSTNKNKVENENTPNPNKQNVSSKSANWVLKDTTIKFLWRENKYDTTLKDTFSTIIVNEQYCKIIPEPVKAAVAFVATFIGNDCNWDGEGKEDRSNLKCKILSALDLGYQCSEQHLGFLRKWFRGDKRCLKELEDCPTTPSTASDQETFDEMRVDIKNNKIIIYSKIDGVIMQESKSWHYTEKDSFVLTGDSLNRVSTQQLKK
jgi:hypothetical protein